ncbi:MAG TPA: class I SAM-dependent methyltransferase [Planctomycetaceae bacterium]|nr:class I SAM-dependent methyltransferase [Planctomycetaceae bacterium]
MPLKRILEPEVMDSVEEARDYDQMDHAAVNEVFVSDLLVSGEIAGEILDLGTGTAQIPVALCQHHEGCRVMAVDLAVHMLDLARYQVEINGLTERIMLDHIDAKSLPYDSDRFEVVMSNSIVHHIPEPATVLAEAIRVVRGGGRLFFRDLLRPGSEEVVQQLVNSYAGEANDHQRQMFDDSLRAALSLDEIRGLISGLGYDPNEVQATSDRHWTWSAEKTCS